MKTLNIAVFSQFKIYLSKRMFLQMVNKTTASHNVTAETQTMYYQTFESWLRSQNQSRIVKWCSPSLTMVTSVYEWTMNWDAKRHITNQSLKIFIYRTLRFDGMYTCMYMFDFIKHLWLYIKKLSTFHRGSSCAVV